MMLGRSDAARLILRIVGYQYPGLKIDSRCPEAGWDSNWLLMDCEAVASDGRVRAFRAPCLTTWEAQSLAAWLGGVLDRRRTNDRLSFTEPDLAFDLVERSATDALIRVKLRRGERAHAWARSRVGEAPDGQLLIPTSDAELERGLRDWHEATERFPTR